MRNVQLPSGDPMPALGQGTWHMAEAARRRSQEVAALGVGLDLGMTLIDTAEMYADGASETLVGEAIQGRRDEVFLVSKVLPENAARRDVIKACERSLRRLRTDRLDLYLLHWRGAVPLEETVDAFRKLARDGKIRHWGVSNFDTEDMEELVAIGGTDVATNQVLYNLVRRGIEFDLLPWCRERKIPIMAYSPIEQGRLLSHPTLAAVADKHGATPAQAALAWVLRHPDVAAIPKAGTADHVREDWDGLSVRLDRGDLTKLDEAFPPPASKEPLEVL
jgi:diketogulonate reductase-like aldo/keto reductase